MKNDIIQLNLFTQEEISKLSGVEMFIERLSSMGYLVRLEKCKKDDEIICEYLFFFGGYYICSFMEEKKNYIFTTKNRSDVKDSKKKLQKDLFFSSYFFQFLKNKPIEKLNEENISILLFYFEEIKCLFFLDYTLDVRFNGIEINNYRLFKNQEIKFENNITVFIGPNGVGKSSILDALNIAMSNFIKKLPVKSPSFTISENDIRVRGKNMIPEKNSILVYNINFGKTRFDWILVKNSRISLQNKQGPILSNGFLFLADDESEFNKSRTITFPILLSYDSHRVNKNTSRFKKNHNDINIMDSRLYAYHDFIKSPSQLTDCRAGFMDREKEELSAYRQGLDLKIAGIPLNIVKDVLKKSFIALNEDSKFYIEDLFIKKKEIVVKFSDNTIVPLLWLSDGYKEIIGIIADISYRMVVLNPHLKYSVLESPGIVLIDEIDVHLHPKWQTKILPLLSEVFPNIQFIITTHSPLVISTTAMDQTQVINIIDGKINISSIKGNPKLWYFSEVLEIGFNIEKNNNENEKIKEEFKESIDLAKKYLQTEDASFLDSFNIIYNKINKDLPKLQLNMLESYRKALDKNEKT